VVLFDEIERRILMSLTYAADHGRRPTHRRQGPAVDFRNAIIIMTSNIGSSYLVAENLRTAEDFEKPPRR